MEILKPLHYLTKDPTLLFGLSGLRIVLNRTGHAGVAARDNDLNFNLRSLRKYPSSALWKGTSTSTNLPPIPTLQLSI